MGGLDPGSTGRRKIAGRVGFVLYVLGVCALLGYTFTSTSEVDSPVAPVLDSTHTDERLELQADYPSDWYLQTFNMNLGLGDHVGFVISNVNHDFEHPDLDGGEFVQNWDMRALPDSAVVIEVSLHARFTYVPCERSRNEFPLDLSTYVLARDHHSYGAPPRLWTSPCIDGSYLFGNHVWFFPDASAEDRKTAETIVESIDQLS